MNALTQKLIRAAKDAAEPIQSNFFGRVSRFDGHIIECDGFPATIGTLCWIETRDSARIVAEVIGFQNKNNLLCVHETGARQHARVQNGCRDERPHLLGRPRMVRL